ncbi:MAG: asparagine synthase-related protein [Acidobacteriota bacterium]
MPGLIGMVQLDRSRPLEAGSAARLLDEMADRLQHVGSEKFEIYADWRGGFAVARVGLEALFEHPWPAARRGADRLFLDGPVHRGDGSPGASQLWSDSPSRPPEDAEIARRLEGFWCAVSYRRGGAVSLMVDRRASRPLAYTVQDGVLYFAPEVKALLAVPGLDRRMDPAAMGLFFASGFMLSTQTFFSGIHRLEGGTLLEIPRVAGSAAAPTLRRYASYRFTVEGDGTPYEEIRRLLGEQIRRSVLRNYEDPEKDLIFLSGGKDSRLILASALGAVDDPRRVRTVSWTSNDPPQGSDVFIARQLAGRFGFDFREVERVPAGYGQKALRLTYILDGLTDIGAYHGDELRLMEELSEQGFRRVLRGDQCFTRGRAMLDSSYAILRMCIRSTSGLADGEFAWHPEAYRRVCEGGDAVIEGLAAEYREVQEDNTGDEVYFRHRLQGYLNAAAYFKTLVLDHRNPLLDEGLLRLIQRLSVAARDEQKILDEAGSESFSPVWQAFAFAGQSNLESFTDLLSRETPVRRAALAELRDEDSAVWEWLDRRALLRRLESLAPAAPGGARRRLLPDARSLRGAVKGSVKRVVSKAVYDIPALDTRLRRAYLRRITRDDEVLLRAIALKQTVDLFVTGDGSRSCFEARLEKLRGAERGGGAGHA